jgi:aspartate aminotransferase
MVSKMKVSDRSRKMIQPAIVKYNGLIKEVEKIGKKIYFLNLGQPDIPTPPAFMDAVRDIDDEVLMYVDSKGIIPLRQSIVNYFKNYNIEFDTDEILLTVGGSEAIWYTFMTLCDPGDEIICTDPVYSIYREVAKATNVVLVPMETYAENGFELPDVKTIEKLITKKTRAFILNTPGNPTGRVYTKREMDDIAQLAKKHNMFIISDEVYRDFIYDGEEFLSFAARKDVEDRVILIESSSKRFSACGVRIGFLATKNKEVYEGLLKMAQTRLSVSYIDQIGAVELFKLDKNYLHKQLAEYEVRRDTICDELLKIDGVVLRKPKGAFHILVKLPIKDSEDFIQFLLNEFSHENETVLITPGADFYFNEELGKNMVRISYVLKAEDLKRAAKLLKIALEEYKKK